MKGRDGGSFSPDDGSVSSADTAHITGRYDRKGGDQCPHAHQHSEGGKLTSVRTGRTVLACYCDCATLTQEGL